MCIRSRRSWPPFGQLTLFRFLPLSKQLRATSIATNALELYFLESSEPKFSVGEGNALELKDQFVCRAWYAKALLHAIGCEGQTGRSLVVGTLDALRFLLTGLKLALSDRRYLFLVFDASVHYAVISRPLQKTGTRRQLVESSTLVAEGLESIVGREAWRAQFLRLHALCLSDADKNDEALQVASKAYDLCKENVPELSNTMVKLKSHIGALSGKKEGGDGADGVAALVQFVRSGACKDAVEVESTLKEAWAQVDPAASSEGEAVNQPVEGVDMNSVAYIGWIAAQHQLRELADWCVRRAEASESTLARARSALTSHLLALDELGEKKGSLDSSAIEVHKKVVNKTDGELSSFLRLQDSSGVQDACQLIWTASLPLLQPNLRHSLTRVFASALSALESVESTLNRLRAALHLELAHCYVAEDNLKEAHAHVSKGLTLDYTATEAEVARTGYERPLDRYLVPLEHALKIKGGFHDDKESIEDQVLLLTELAREAKSSRSSANLLHDAFDRLSSLDKLLPYPVKDEPTADVDEQEGDAPEPEADAEADAVTSDAPDDVLNAENVRRRATARLNLWANMCRTAADARLYPLAHSCAANVFGVTGWDAVRDKETIVLQIEVNYVDGAACAAMLRAKGVSVLPPLEVNVDGTSSDLEVDLQNGASAAFLRSARLGMSVNESWAVMNAATHAWNIYIDAIKNHRYAEMLALSAPLLEALKKLEDCDPELLGNYAHLVASGFEHKAYLVANSRPKETTETPSADDGEEQASSAEADTPAKPEGEIEETRVVDYDALCAEFALRVLEDSDDMNQAIATCEFALAHVDETSTRKLSAMLARLQAFAGGASVVTIEDDVVAQVAAMIPQITKGDAKEGGEILSRAIGLLRPEGASVAGDVEIWARLGQAGLAIKSFGAAIDCCEQASASGKALEGSASPQNLYWSGVAACAYGNSVVGLVRPAQQDESVQNTLKQKAFERFVEAAKYGRRANRGDIVCYAAKCFWNAGTSFMGSASARKILVKPLEVILEAARAAKVSDYKFLQSAYMLLFDCLMDASEWEKGTKQVEAAFKVLPSNEHKPLWEYKVMFLSAVGKSVDEDISIISEYDEEMQAKIWTVLAAQATVPFDAMRAHRKAIDVLKYKPAMQIEYIAHFAEWLNTSSGQPASDAEDTLLSAVDVLLAIDSEDDATATMFGTKQICSAIRVFLMLSKISGDNDVRTDHLLIAQQYAVRLLRECMIETSEGTPLPETAEDWAHFTFSEATYDSIRKNVGLFEITVESVGRPELLHAYIEYLCAALETRSMHVQCLPLCQLGLLIAKLAAENEALVAVYHLKLAALCDALLLRTACTLHESLAGPLDLSDAEAKQGRLEVKRADALTQSGDEHQPDEASTSKLLRPLALRDYWLARGAYLVRRGAFSAASTLLQETVVHAHAHGDAETEAWAYIYLARCASSVNKPVDAIRLQLRGQSCAGDVAFWGENLADFAKDKLNTRDGQLSAKDSLLTALKLLRSRLVFAGRGESLDTKLVLADLHIELSNVLQVEMQQVLTLGGRPDALFDGAMRAVSEAITILRTCGSSMNLVKSLLSLADLMYKDPSMTDNPRPTLKTVANVVSEAEVQAEEILAIACEGSVNPLRSSLPAARLLAAVKSAKALCLLELAKADRAFENFDKQQNRPDFPTIQGADASAILAFLDDSVSETFDVALGSAEQAVVAASEAVNLHKKSNGSVNSLYLLGDALLTVHNTQIKTEAWKEPPPPTVPPVPSGDDAEGEAVEPDENAVAETDAATEGEDQEEHPDDPAENTSEDSRVEESSDTEEVTSVAHPEFAPDLTKSRAIRALEQSIDVGLKTAKYDSVSKAALCLAHAYGSAEPGNAAAALALSQSSKVAELQLSIFASATDDQDVEALLIRNKRLLEATLGDPAASKHSASLLDRLDSSSQAWRSIQIDPGQCMASPPSLPEDLSVFSLQWIHGRGDETFLAIGCHNADAGRAGAHVARADATQLSAALSLVNNFKLSEEKRASGGATAEGHSVTSGWNEVCEAVKFVLRPVLSAWKSFLGGEGATGKKIVLLVDEFLSPLPLEALDFLADAAAVSRDFSLHILLGRLTNASSRGDVSPSEVTYLVDLRNEDEGEDGEIPIAFAAMKERFGAGWHGAQGSSDGLPGEGECQRVLSSARGALMYFGHGRFMSYVPPPAIACLDMTQCRLALLACNTTNEAARAAQARLDNRKNEQEKRLEDPFRTAALLSTRGVETIVLPIMPCTPAGNSETITGLLGANEALEADSPPVDVASAVWNVDKPKATAPLEDAGEAKEAERDAEAADDSGDAKEELPYRRYVVWGLPSIKIRA